MMELGVVPPQSIGISYAGMELSTKLHNVPVMLMMLLNLMPIITVTIALELFVQGCLPQLLDDRLHPTATNPRVVL